MAFSSGGKGRPLIVAALAAALVIWSPQAATAQVAGPTFQGSVWGCFWETGQAECTPQEGVDPVFREWIQFFGSSFSIPTEGPDGGPFTGRDEENVGSFFLHREPADYNDVFFRALYTFTQPGSNNTIFSAFLAGAVTVAGGTVTVNYEPPLTDAWTGGGFFNTVTIDPVVTMTYPGNQTGFNALTVTATPVPVPEPVGMALLGTGLFGVAMMLRRRRKATEPESS
jgi:hypothetical protein